MPIRWARRGHEFDDQLHVTIQQIAIPMRANIQKRKKFKSCFYLEVLKTYIFNPDG